ncbi:MAG: hypothetical protein OXG04_24175 [Acidobacteria bacterium]|nr:hypothetical protein [Acidobacteriota bacterium]
MPNLDRRINVSVCASTTNAFGETVETTTDYPQWGALIQDKLARNFDVGGVYGLADRVWRVRFDQRLVDAIETGQTVTVDYGAEAADIVTGAGEPVTRETRRRRFLDLLS